MLHGNGLPCGFTHGLLATIACHGSGALFGMVWALPSRHGHQKWEKPYGYLISSSMLRERCPNFAMVRPVPYQSTVGAHGARTQLCECSLAHLVLCSIPGKFMMGLSMDAHSGGPRIRCRGTPSPCSAFEHTLRGQLSISDLVDPASSHMLVSKIKPCMS